MNITDFLNAGFEQYADIGFTLLIGGVCLRTLLFDREVNVKQRAVWKQELVELEKSLRSLIDEASHSSHVFDRQLATKQNNIQKLVDKAESLLKASISNATKSTSKKANPRTIEDQIEERPTLKKINARFEKDDDDWTYGDEVPSYLMQAVERTNYEEDRRFHGRLSPQSGRSTYKPNPTKSAHMINEEKKKQEALADEKIFSQTSIVDPIAYRIAKRLLLEGKELHVIARKLEMPVSEIRHLETLIRQQAQQDHADLPESFKAKDIDAVTKVIRDRGEKNREQKLLREQIETVHQEYEDNGLVFEDDTGLPQTLEK